VSYRLTVRRGPRVEKSREETLDEALTALEAAARTTARRDQIQALGRTYDPVAARIEITGPGVRAGIDVRGDGAMIAWRGRIRRSVIEPVDGESAMAALRRTLNGTGAPPP
jgi:hypothetical protein